MRLSNGDYTTDLKRYKTSAMINPQKLYGRLRVSLYSNIQ